MSTENEPTVMIPFTKSYTVAQKEGFRNFSPKVLPVEEVAVSTDVDPKESAQAPVVEVPVIPVKENPEKSASLAARLAAQKQTENG